MSNALTVIVSLGVPSAITGLCFWYLKKHIDKKDRLREEQDAARQKNEVLMVQSISAAMALGEATALAMKNGRCNGETEAALNFAKEVRNKQKDFLTEQGIKNIY